MKHVSTRARLGSSLSLVQYEMSLNSHSVHDHRMKELMNIQNLTTVEALDSFIQGNQTAVFTVLGDKKERYQFIQSKLIKFCYITLSTSS
jgi:hypothetical protein